MTDVSEKFVKFLNGVVGKGDDKLITETELAKRVNCTLVSMDRYLKREREIPLRTVLEIKKVLGISDEMFMEFYSGYSSAKKMDPMYYKFNNEFLKLSDENKEKLVEYMEFLNYQERTQCLKLAKNKIGK